MVETGLIFFGGLSVSLLSLAALDKLNVRLNHTAVRIVAWAGILGYGTYAVLKNPLIRMTLTGF